MATTTYPAGNRLNADVIWEIIRINGNMYIDKGALDDTRHASQVCRAWRAAIVNTPLLWARLIDLDSLHGLRSNEWGKEIVRRSGKAPIWIKAVKNWTRYSHPVPEQRVFFRDIMLEHWERVQILHISTLVLVYKEMWKVPLCRPAPTLDTLYIHSTDRYHSRTIGVMHKFANLFAGCAPMLRNFSVDYHKVDLNSRWLLNLRSIMLDSAYNLYECLFVLSATRNLEHLKITDPIGEAELPIHLQHVVRLPMLKYLLLSLNFDDMNFMLDHLVIPHGCSLRLSTWPSLMTENHAPIGYTFNQVMSKFSQLSKSYFESHLPQTMELSCFDDGVILHDTSYPDDFGFEMQCRYYHGSSDSMASTYTAITLPELAGVTELRLRYNVLISPAPHPSFLQCFSSVELLHTNEQLFGDLITAQDALSIANDHRTIIFPKLKRIKLRLGDGVCYPSRTVGDMTEKFILSRIEDGYPISILDLTAFDECDVSPVLIRLQSITSLQVIWRSKSDIEVWHNKCAYVLRVV